MQIHTNQYKYMKIDENLCKSMQLNANRWESLQISENRCKRLQLNANTWKPVRLHATRCKSTHINAIQCRYMQTKCECLQIKTNVSKWLKFKTCRFCKSVVKLSNDFVCVSCMTIVLAAFLGMTFHNAADPNSPDYVPLSHIAGLQMITLCQVLASSQAEIISFSQER